VTLRGLLAKVSRYGQVEVEHTTGFESPMNTPKPTC
jgi:hypothetical protein